MTTTPPPSGDAPTAVRLLHVDAHSASMPPAQAKPTSLTGQHESTLEAWLGAPNASTGVWECEPGEFTAERIGVTEVCHIVSGNAIVEGDDGASAEIGPGSLLVLPDGWRGRWIVRESIRKTYTMIPSTASAAADR